MKYRGNNYQLCITLVATILALGSPAFCQTADEHAKHHAAPGGASPAPAGQAAPVGMPMPGGGNPAPTTGGDMGATQPTTAPGATNPAPAPGAMGGAQPAGAGAGGMAAGMGEMMKQMGVPPRKEIYPSLMALPDEVTPEQRAGIEQLAYERMKAGTALISSSLEKLSDSTSDQDYVAMQQATAQMREGLAQFEAGIAARRVLSEGKLPRNLALDWFKREMNLSSPIRPQEPRTFLGVPPFHLFTMILLIAFVLAMVAMYFFKMRRAAALFGRIAPDTNPPPGSSPPLAGSAPSSAAGTPPSSAAPSPASPTAPPKDKSPAPDPPPGGASPIPIPAGGAVDAG